VKIQFWVWPGPMTWPEPPPPINDIVYIPPYGGYLITLALKKCGLMANPFQAVQYRYDLPLS
jgi:hypothetical protein